MGLSLDADPGKLQVSLIRFATYVVLNNINSIAINRKNDK